MTAYRARGAQGAAGGVSRRLRPDPDRARDLRPDRPLLSGIRVQSSGVDDADLAANHFNQPRGLDLAKNGREVLLREVEARGSRARRLSIGCMGTGLIVDQTSCGDLM